MNLRCILTLFILLAILSTQTKAEDVIDENDIGDFLDEESAEIEKEESDDIDDILDANEDFSEEAITGTDPVADLIASLKLDPAYQAELKKLKGRGGKKDKEQAKVLQQKVYLAQNCLVDGKKMLLKANYDTARELLKKAYELTPQDAEVIKFYQLSLFPAVSVSTEHKIFSLVKEKKVNTSISIDHGLSDPNWIKKWEIRILDEYDEILRSIKKDGKAPAAFSWDGTLKGRKKIGEGTYKVEVILHSDWNCRATSQPYRFTIDNTPPGLVIFVSSNSFTPGESTVSLSIKAEKSDKIAKWQLEVRNSIGELVRTVSGKGAVSDRLDWDGNDDTGKAVQSGDIYYLKITGKDNNNSMLESNEESIEAAIRVKKEKKELTFDLSTIQFETGKSDLKPESRPLMKMVADILKKYSYYNVNIVGHTDNVGNEKSNLSLSRKRALSVLDYLSSELGIDKSRMSAEGRGESEPVADNKTAAGRSRNRRVEFSLKK